MSKTSEWNDTDVSDTIKKIIGNIAYGNIDDYFSDENMIIWISSVTNETVDTDNNYQLLKYFGTYILNTNFALYCTIAYPGLGEDGYTNVVNSFLTSEHHKEMAQKLGLDSLLRTVKDITSAIDNIESDLYLSFFAALYFVSEKVTEGTGSAICFNIVNKIYKNIEIEDYFFEKPAKGKFIQLFQRFGDIKSTDDYVTYRKDGSFDIEIPDQVAEKFDVKTKFLGNYINVSKDEAFRSALEILEKEGVVSRLSKENESYVYSDKWDDDRIAKWKADLKETVRKVVKTFLPEKIINDMFFTRGNIAILMNSFTDHTYDPDVEKNYDIPEFIGDRILNMLFLLHCYSLDNKLTRMDYSNLLHFYQEKTQQANITKMYKFDKVFRTSDASKNDEKVYGDIFESFVGGLYSIGNQMENGLGMELCYIFIKKLYPVIEKSNIKPPYISIFTQIFQRLGIIGKKKEYLSTRDTGHLISLPPRTVEFLIDNGIKVPRNSMDKNGRYIIGEYNTDIETAFENALKVLERIGVTTEWSTDMKRKLDLNLVDEDVRNKAEAIANKLNVDLYIERPGRISTTYFLYGRKRDVSEKRDNEGKKLLLATIATSNKILSDSRKEGYTELLRRFIQIHGSEGRE